jgi:hypothetical protein
MPEARLPGARVLRLTTNILMDGLWLQRRSAARRALSFSIFLKGR